RPPRRPRGRRAPGGRPGRLLRPRAARRWRTACRRVHGGSCTMTARELAAPSPFVTEHLAAARPGVALDVACGRGRHALALARAGRRGEAIDRSIEACRELRQRAARERLPIEVVCAGLTGLPLPRCRYAAIGDTLYLGP